MPDFAYFVRAMALSLDAPADTQDERLADAPQDAPAGRRPGPVMLRDGEQHAVVVPSWIAAVYEFGPPDDPRTAILLSGGKEFCVACPINEVLAALGEPWASLVGEEDA